MRIFSIIILLLSTIQFYAQIKAGDQCIDIQANNKNDSICALSAYANHLIIVTFWASNCRPCRKYCNPWVKTMYQKYHKDGLQVFSVNIDKNKTNWLNALLQDSCQGIQVNEPLGWQCKSVFDYSIKSIPEKILFYKGICIMANASMNEMEEKIKEILMMKN
jgi:thiol-disulfide isomerase/thioredoxin